MDLERSPFLRLVKDQLRDSQGTPLEYLVGGDDDAIDFWLTLTGNCDVDEHAQLHQTMWSIIDSRPYRCLNHGDVDPTNIFKLNPQSRAPDENRCDCAGTAGDSSAAKFSDATIAVEQARLNRTSRVQQLGAVAPASITNATADVTGAQVDIRPEREPEPEPEAEPELAWIDWQFARAGVPGLDIAALLTRALVRYPDPVRYIPLIFERSFVKVIQAEFVSEILAAACNFALHHHKFIIANAAGCEN